MKKTEVNAIMVNALMICHKKDDDDPLFFNIMMITVFLSLSNSIESFLFRVFRIG